MLVIYYNPFYGAFAAPAMRCLKKAYILVPCMGRGPKDHKEVRKA
jgi:hypothetical protein